jgi:PAT family beta-lactamase induction signal transducer AmpG
MLAILALGAASGFPNQISESTLQAWLKSTGSTNTTIGLLTYVGLPYLLKFLWAPLLDRYPLPLLGRRRGWILATQLGMIVSVLLLAVQEPTSSLIPIAICALLIVTFSASQDVVIDAYRADVTLPHERGLAAASNNLGYRAASWLAPAFALIVADFYGWRAAFITLAVGIALLTVAPTRAPEPLYRDAPPRTLADSVILPLRALLGTPGALALIVLIMLFKVGDAFALRLFTPFLIDSGFSLTEIGLVTKTVLTSSAIAGAVLGGIWMVKLGLLRAMLFFGVLQTIANLGYWLLAIVGKDMPLMIAVTALDNVAGGMGQVASVALIMAMCQARFSAFQYALLSVFALLPRYALGGPAGVLADSAGWDGYFLVSFFMGLPGIALVWLMRDRIRGYDVVGQKA